MEAKNFGAVNPLLRGDNVWDPIKLEDTLWHNSAGSPSFLLIFRFFITSFEKLFA